MSKSSAQFTGKIRHFSPRSHQAFGAGWMVVGLKGRPLFRPMMAAPADFGEAKEEWP
jgi:hypothetical protein